MVGDCYKTLTVISNYYGKKEKSKKEKEKLISISLKQNPSLNSGRGFVLRGFFNISRVSCAPKRSMNRFMLQ